LLVNYQLNYLKENGLPPTAENIDAAHPAMPSENNPAFSSSRHGPDELVAFGEKLKAEMVRQKPILSRSFCVNDGDVYNFSYLAKIIERLPEVARSTESCYAGDVWYTQNPLMIMHKFYKCSLFKEHEGMQFNFPWHLTHTNWVYLRASSALDLPDRIEDFKKLKNTSNTLMGSHRVCPMLFSVEQGIEKKGIREDSFSLFTSQPMVVFRQKHFYFLPHKTKEQWIESRAASFLGMARKVLRKHKSLFPDNPIIPETATLPKDLVSYLNMKSTIGDLDSAAYKAKKSYILDLSQDSDSDSELEDPCDENLVETLLGIVSAEGGTRTNSIKISLSCSNGYIADGLMSFETAKSNRISVSACIQKDLINPILGEYRKLKQEAKSLGINLTSDEQDKELLRKVGDILNDKMGLTIYK
jgi:hypothetical protein